MSVVRHAERNWGVQLHHNIPACLSGKAGMPSDWHSRRSAVQRGFTLVEILTALAIASVLAAMIVPTLLSSFRTTKTTRMAEDLTSIAQGIREFEKHVGVFPIDLDELTTKPVFNTDKNSCGALLTQAQIDKWRGPYLPKSAPFIEEEDTIFDVIKRKNGSTKNPDVLQLSIRQPPASTALRLDSLFDGDGSLTAGTITWNNNNYPGEMFYSIPVQGC